MTTSTARRLARRSGCGLAALALTLAACGDNSGSDDTQGDDTSSTSRATPEEAYAAFAAAIRDNDADAFDAAVHDMYWSDLTGEQDDDVKNLAIHHWSLENGVMTLPDDPGQVLVGDDAFTEDNPSEEGVADQYAAQVAKVLDLDDLSGDDLAVVVVPEGFDNGLAGQAEGENCVEDERPIEECLGESADESVRQDVDVILVRGDDGWQVFGTETA